MQDLIVSSDKPKCANGKKFDDTDNSITVMQERLSELVDGLKKVNDDATDLKDNASKESYEIFEKQLVHTAQIIQQEIFTEIANEIIEHGGRETSKSVKNIVSNIGTKTRESNLANDIRNVSSNKEADTGTKSSGESTVKNTQLHDILDSMEVVKVSTYSLNAENVLENIDFKNQSTEVIFDAVSKLDLIKMTAMEELRTRMFSKRIT